MLTKRGVLIVLEGCDKAGKSTQAKLLQKAVVGQLGRPCHIINFPDRTTVIGQMIDQYLRCKTELKDEAIHLLFSANRWELVPKINNLLMNGESIILDRYAFSGVAFSAAKGTLDLEWCISPDVGLPKPDRVIYLNLSKEVASQRSEYGQERYENLEFQEKVKRIFFQLRDDAYWKIVEADKPIESVHEQILQLVLQTVTENENKPIELLWKSEKNFKMPVGLPKDS